MVSEFYVIFYKDSNNVIEPILDIDMQAEEHLSDTPSFSKAPNRMRSYLSNEETVSENIINNLG